ncbi:S8 family serine peptidase [Rufibacter sediminis]|uniref:S8 family serine peptidase n=1 Tax=Rufibacter sediminis TaxID=2762756 RepID=A0ABR6VXC8_9BACT|nr:S8 family serine peptidase [Rufibacter sediminis]MBC3541448.1 S8 family serine peptidase [Rufibacter sediminis]
MLNKYVSIPRFKFLIGAAVVVSSCTFQSCEQVEEAAQPEEVVGISDSGSLIAGKYIVVLKNGSNLRLAESASYPERLRQVKNFGQEILRERGINPEAIGQSYGKALQGFEVDLTEAEAAKLGRDSRVAYVEQDKIISLGKPSGGGSTPSGQVTPYGITRVGFGDGTGKTAWVIDTGIDLDHPDLNVDAARSMSVFTSGRDAGTADDGNGHGTHVAGTIAAKNNSIGVIGVAANATVVAVKVLDSRGSGSTSGVIAGIDYVAANGKPGDVANMSLGGGVSTALDNAVIEAAKGGVIFCLASGNETDNANNHSPARANGLNVYTISAMNNTDTWASFSNYGNPPVDYCAPGVSIQSTWKDGGYNTISGTSMATPHAAGVMLMTGGKPTTSGLVKNDPDGNADPIIHL